MKDGPLDAKVNCEESRGGLDGFGRRRRGEKKAGYLPHESVQNGNREGKNARKRKKQAGVQPALIKKLNLRSDCNK